MDLVLLIGIPASGKSSFYKELFYNSHIRVNLDMLRTRNREDKLLDFCFSTSMPLVIDNTNVRAADRKKYIDLGKANKFKIRGYYFKSDLKKCMERNNLREGKEKLEERGILAKYNQLELPKIAEGFDDLYYVVLDNENKFILDKWQDEI
jgi:predicted kinase